MADARNVSKLPSILNAIVEALDQELNGEELDTENVCNLAAAIHHLTTANVNSMLSSLRQDLQPMLLGGIMQAMRGVMEPPKEDQEDA